MQKIFSVKDKDMKLDEKKKKEVIDALENVAKRTAKERKDNIEIDLGFKTMLFILLILAVIFFGQQLLTIVIFLFFGFILMSAAKPVVNWFVSKKISKGWALALTYVLGFIVFACLVSAVLIPFAEQVTDLVNTIPQWIDQVLVDFEGFTIGSFSFDSKLLTDLTADLLKGLTTTGNFKNIANILSGAFGGFTLFITAVIFSIYILWDHDTLLDVLLVRIPSDQKRSRVKKLVLDTENNLGSWMLGQATVSSIAGIVLGSFLAILGVPFALPLGVMVALLDAIPNIGATVATIPAILVALLALGPVNAVIVFVGYILYQQIENNIVIPKIMGNAVGMRPVVVMLGAMIFLILFGVWGALLAVPVLVLGQIVYDFYIDLQKLKAKGIV